MKKHIGGILGLVIGLIIVSIEQFILIPYFILGEILCATGICHSTDYMWSIGGVSGELITKILVIMLCIFIGSIFSAFLSDHKQNSNASGR